MSSFFSYGTFYNEIIATKCSIVVIACCAPAIGRSLVRQPETDLHTTKEKKKKNSKVTNPLFVSEYFCFPFRAIRKYYHSIDWVWIAPNKIYSWVHDKQKRIIIICIKWKYQIKNKAFFCIYCKFFFSVLCEKMWWDKDVFVIVMWIHFIRGRGLCIAATVTSVSSMLKGKMKLNKSQPLAVPRSSTDPVVCRSI